MIIAEKCTHTKKELEFLFQKLVKEGFFWVSGEYLLGTGLDFVQKYPAYIHLYDNKKVTWSPVSIPPIYWVNYSCL